MFYHDNKDKARELIAKQIADGWSRVDICNYFEMLGYDWFFCREVVDPFFINTNDK